MDYVGVLLRRKWWLVATVILCTAGSFGFSKAQTVKYTAVAAVLYQGQPNVSATNGVVPQPVTEAEVISQEQLFTSSTIRNIVLATLPKPGGISVSIAGSPSAVLDITGTAKGPKLAAATANTYARAFVTYEQQQVLGRISAVENQLKSRLAGVNTYVANLEKQVAAAGPNSQVQQAQLSGALVEQSQLYSDLLPLQAPSLAGTGASIVSTATPPVSPSSPRTKRNLAIGFGIGLLLGLMVCGVVDRIDDRVRSKSELETATGGIPTLGFIPSIPTWKSAEKAFTVSIAKPQSLASEAYRSLRTALQFVFVDKGVRRVLISSAVMGEGKTATTANLGVALARAGQRVLIVSADLRRPRLGAFVSLEETVGLTSVVLGSTSLSAAIQSVPGVPGLSFLGTGPLPPHPAEFLASKRVIEIMDEASTRFDIILIDCAPVVPVADSLAAYEWCDIAVLVVRADVTRRRQLRRAVELLESVDANICGTVFNDVSPGGGSYRGYRYGYNYGYGYGYGYTSYTQEQPEGSSGSSGSSGSHSGPRGRRGRKAKNDEEASPVTDGADIVSDAG
jgi:receptor protein-tyrosine kinase